MRKLLLVAFGASILCVVSAASIDVPSSNDDQDTRPTEGTGPTSPTRDTEDTPPSISTDNVEPTCPENQVYSNCSNALCRNEKCEQRGIPVACPAVAYCDKACVCAVGFLNNSKGICVKEDECDVGPKCPENQIFSYCTTGLCRHQECYERGQPEECPGLDAGSCLTGCVCDVGYLRNTNGHCVKEDQCDVEPSCPENQVYSNCSNALCRAERCEQKGIPVACPSVPSCDKACVCAVGFLKNSNGICVKEDECDVGPKCPENQIFSNCTNALCRHQECYERGQPVGCPGLVEGSCLTGCVCDVGYLRNTNGNCVKEDQCDAEPSCPENQVYSNCSNAICRHQECSQRGQPIGCAAVSSCDKGCVCAEGFLRNSNGNCVKEDQCDVQPTCPENQVYSNCSNALCRAERCEQKGIPVACPSVPSCDKACVCAVGFLKNSNGICVKEDECDVGPKCPENQIFSNCTNALCRHQECYERGQPVGCPGLVEGSCLTGCVCDVGYLRNTNGHCVKEDQCDAEPSCPENQVYSNCSNAICRHQECSQRGQPIGCAAVSSCDKGCVCAEGFLRNSNGNCVKEDQCDVQPTCPENQVYSNCSNALCRAERCEQKGIPVACPSVPSCDKACVCAVGFLKNSNGICVKEDECDVGPKCPDNQVFSNCTNALCRHQECYERGQPVGCPGLVEGSCLTGCVCDVGYLRNTNGNCVKEDQCDVEPSCPENQVYSNCSNAICRHQECSQRGQPIGCAAVSSCDKGCVCAEGFLRNSNGNCVKEDQCDVEPTCPENQVYSNCSNAICRHQECSQRGQPIGCPAVSSCDKGCVCAEGFLRNSNGNCVKEDQCDDVPTCPQNEVSSACANGLCRAQECSQKDQPMECPALAEGSCRSACVCKEGYLRNKSKKCVKTSKCD